MNELPHPDHQFLEAAEGWLGLGDWREASLELAQIQPQFHTHPAVLEIRYKIHAEAKQWERAVAVAQQVRDRLPNDLWGHFYTAYAQHELKHTRAAYETLYAVAANFPKDYLVCYNLACYACQLGKLEEAMRWLKQAMSLADKRNLTEAALQDPDLQPLWPQIRPQS
jgi:tetratricopeptide (TPR) repeat protein